MSFRGSGIDRRVVFRITRIWKGRLTQTFEMPAMEGDWCYAFLLNQLVIRKELLVYARRIQALQLQTTFRFSVILDPCSVT